MDPPANPWFHDVVSALVHSLAEVHGSSPAALNAPYNDLTRFVLRQHAQMPDYLREPMLAATIGFDLLGITRSGRLFHSRPAAVRKKQIAAWKNSGISMQRDLIRYYESLATLALYSREAQRGQSGSLSESSGTTGVNPNQILSKPEGELRCETAVIGSGPGGAIMACLLAEAGRNVLLIEEAPFQPLEACAPFSLEEMLRKYRNGGQTVAMGRNKIAYVEGRCVGGGSEINSGLYHRTPPEILERWRKEFRVEGLGEKDLLPHFEALERDLSVSLAPGAPPLASVRLQQGAERLGWTSLEVPRWSRYGYASSSGDRQSMSKTFIPRFMRAGGRLLPCARVERIRQDCSKWQMQARHKTGGLRIEAETLFVCGGAVQTPALLRRSGITRNVGDSLRLHPTVKVVARFPDSVNSAEMGVPAHQVKEFAPRLSFGCSISTPPYVALGMIDHPQYETDVSAVWAHMANYYAMIASESRGTVRPIGRFRDPLVRYSLTEKDRRDLADGFAKLAHMLFEAGAAAVYPGLSGGPELRCRDDIAKLPCVLPNGLASLMTIHLFSSCPMGEDERRCATDSFGRIHGFHNLFIADASLLCTAPGVNPQGSIMALTRRNALHFLGLL